MDNKKHLIDLIDESILNYTDLLVRLKHMLEMATKVEVDLKRVIPKNNDFNEVVKLQRFHSLLVISLLDLYVSSKHLLNAKSDWEKVFFIKQSFLIIYETIDKYSDHNKDIKEFCETRFVELKDDYLTISNDLKLFKKTFSYENMIKSIRNNIAGHIHSDFLKYFDTLLLLKDVNATDLISSFINILKKLETLSNSLIDLSNKQSEKEFGLEGLSVEDMREMVNAEILKIKNKSAK